MRNDSLETLLLRHYGSQAPVPVDLEQRITTLLRQEERAALQARQEATYTWQQRRVSRRRLLQLVTLSGAGVSALAIGLNSLQGQRRPAYS